MRSLLLPISLLTTTASAFAVAVPPTTTTPQLVPRVAAPAPAESTTADPVSHDPCTHISGTILYSHATISFSLLDDGLAIVELADPANPVIVCQGPHRIDQDNNFSLTCKEGYVFALEQSGGRFWFRNGIGTEINGPLDLAQDGVTLTFSQTVGNCGMERRRAGRVVI